MLSQAILVASDDLEQLQSIAGAFQNALTFDGGTCKTLGVNRYKGM